MHHVRCKFQVSSFSRFKVIAFSIFVYEFVKYAGKNLRTSDAKRRGSPNKNKQIKKQKCRNCHNLFLRAERACSDASKFETFIPLVRLVFELELFKPTIGILFLARKPVPRNRLPPKFARRRIHMYPI